MYKVKSQTDKYSVFIMIAFFAVILMMYARGINYDAGAAENGLIIVRKESSIAPFLIFTTIILFLLNKNKINFKIIANYKLWGAFFLCLFTIALLRGNILNDLNNFGYIIFGYLMFFGLMRFVYRIKFSVLEDCFINISVVILVLCVVFHLLQGHSIVFFPDRSDYNYDRLGGMFYYAHTAAICGITLLFSLNKFLKSKNKKYLFITSFCLLLLVATDTRSAWAATVFSLIFMFFKSVKFYKIFLFCCIIYLISTLVSVFLGSSNKAISTGSNDTEYRTQIWLFSLNKSSQKLLTGYGSDTESIFRNFTETDSLHDPHNSIISLLLQSGLIAVVIYFMIYFKNCNQCNKSFNKDYRFLYFFWLFFPFFWGELYSGLSNFMNMYIMFTIYAFTLNPNMENKNYFIKYQKKLYV